MTTLHERAEQIRTQRLADVMQLAQSYSPSMVIGVDYANQESHTRTMVYSSLGHAMSAPGESITEVMNRRIQTRDVHSHTDDTAEALAYALVGLNTIRPKCKPPQQLQTRVRRTVEI